MDITQNVNNSAVYEITVTDANGKVIDLTPFSSIVFSLKAHAKDVAYVFQKTLGSGVAKVQPYRAGVFQVSLAPADTVNLVPSDYFYDVQVSDGTNKYTVIQGRFFLEPVVNLG